MKIEIEVPEELITKVGQEAIESYLCKKAAQLLQSVKNHSIEEMSAEISDKDLTDKAWQKFNKRGMSC